MRVLFLEVVDSTQQIAAEWVQRNDRSWDAVGAEHQVAGRGRLGARWHDEPGTSLLVSLVLWDVPLPKPPHLISIGAALATAEALEQCFPPLQVGLKYPNDLMVHGRKLGGVLVEMVGGTAVVGIGVNLAQGEFPEPLRETAISVRQAFGMLMTSPLSQAEAHKLATRATRTRLIQQIGTRLKALIAELAQSGTHALHARWQARDVTPGRPYQVLDLPDQPTGVALRVEPDFRLHLRLANGEKYSTYWVHAVPSP